MTAFTKQRLADAATEALAIRIASLLSSEGAEIQEEPYHNGTAPEYGGGYCFTVTRGGEDFHIEVIGPYVEGDENDEL